MKIIKILVTSILVSTVMFGAFPAFAQDVKPDTSTDLKVYYSEELAGGGTKVFHITACSKAQTYAPLRCVMDPDNKTSPYFDPGGQCKKQGASDGDLIKGCITGEDEIVGDATYPKVDLAGYGKKEADGGCSDAPSKQGNYYSPTFAIVDKKGGTDELKSSKWELKGTVVWSKDSSGTISSYIESAYTKPFEKQNENKKPKPETPKFEYVPMYHSVLCVTEDFVAGNNGTPSETPEAFGEITDRIKALQDKVSSEAKRLIDGGKGCNNDNSDVSSVFNEVSTVRCSVMYRISGKTGTDILGQYIASLYRWAAGVVGIVAVLIIVFSGIQMSMAGGDSAKLDSAKNRIMQSIIGIVILLLSALILYTINPTFFT